MALSTLNLFLVTKNIESLGSISSLNLNKIHEIETKLRIEQQYKDLELKFKLLMQEMTILKFDDILEISAFINFSHKFKNKLLKTRIEGDDLLELLTSIIKTIELRTDEAMASLKDIGEDSSNNLINITNIYEDIQKYLPN